MSVTTQPHATALCYWGHDDYSTLYQQQQMRRIVLRRLHWVGWPNLADKELLDVGCKNGRFLRECLEWGAAPDDIAGIEWDAQLVEEAFYRHADLDIRTGEATELPWEANRFDAVSLFESMSRMKTFAQRQQVAQEVVRVLKPGGLILWFEQSAIAGSEIRKLFPNFRRRLTRCGLTPGIANSVPHAWLPAIYPLLSSLPGLRTHWIGTLQER